MLNAFYSCTDRPTRDKYVTKLDGNVACNAYYIAVLGYFQRCFKQLKTIYHVYGRVATVHGNTCQVKENARMSVARESLYVLENKVGCQQPHRSIRRKTDNAVLPLILLPMITTRLDVFLLHEWKGEETNGWRMEMLMSSFHWLGGKSFPMCKSPHFLDFQSAITVESISMEWNPRPMQ